MGELPKGATPGKLIRQDQWHVKLSVALSQNVTRWILFVSLIFNRDDPNSFAANLMSIDMKSNVWTLIVA